MVSINNRIARVFVLSTLMYSVVFSACRNKIVRNEITVHYSADPGQLNPYAHRSELVVSLDEKIFQPLVSIDRSSMKPQPVLVQDLPQVRTDSGNMYFTYTLRPDAKWDNGQPVTAKDVEFSLKMVKCPGIEDAPMRPAYEDVTGFIYDATNPMKFSIVYKGSYILAEQAADELQVIPQYVYDKDNVLGKYPLKDFTGSDSTIANDAAVKKLSAWFNTGAFKNDTTISGSGPYTVASHKANTSVVLARKTKWWGDNYNDRNDYFRAYPIHITYKIMPDQNSAIAAMKAGEIDVMHGLKADQFIALKKDNAMADKFNFYSPQTFMYSYLGINTQNPKFADVRVRQALSHLVDIQHIIDVVQYGLATPVIGPVSTMKKGAYNDTIKPYSFDIEKAKQLLAAAGWRDTDGDGIVDKVINGKKTPLSIDFTFIASNKSRRDAILIFKEAAMKAGVDVHVVPQETNVFLQNIHGHNFEMFYSAFSTNPYPDDFKQLFHTASIKAGSNYTGFGDTNSDKLIETIRTTLDENKRNDLYKQFQVMLHEQAPMIFLFSVNERIVVNKRYSGVVPSAINPGFWEPGFRVTQM